MPLSEHEERILHQIEQGFYAHDPESAKRISSTTLLRYLGRNCKWAGLIFLVGVIILVTSFSMSWILGIVGFAVMLVGAVVLVRNLRQMGRHGWQQLSLTVREKEVGGSFGEAWRRMRRNRFG